MIVLLTSGVTLGTHVPALLLRENLRRLGIEPAVEVFEKLYPDELVGTLGGVRTTLRSDLRVAVAVQRLLRDQFRKLDTGRLEGLLRRWAEVPVTTLIVFSGLWAPVIEEYRRRAGRPVRVEVCHLDSADTASFALHRDLLSRYDHCWFLTASPASLGPSIPVTSADPVGWDARADRVVAHGGGWGIGTYRERAAELAAAGLAVDVVGHERTDLGSLPAGSRWHLLDPDWAPWTDDGFPPLGTVTGSGDIRFGTAQGHHRSFDLAARAVAMVAKPGGGTLLDSVWAATPVVLLEPFGDHEARNAECWRELGYGVGYQDWKESGYSRDLLRSLHDNLRRARQDVADYPARVAALDTAGSR